eukprot:scaffold282332_cov18-Tisochrysis_lutea.AAC.1
MGPTVSVSTQGHENRERKNCAQALAVICQLCLHPSGQRRSASDPAWAYSTRMYSAIVETAAGGIKLKGAQASFNAGLGRRKRLACLSKLRHRVCAH